jgi:hypothetical protein
MVHCWTALRSICDNDGIQATMRNPICMARIDRLRSDVRQAKTRSYCKRHQGIKSCCQSSPGLASPDTLLGVGRAE